jgi:hypothetical protein
MSARRSWAELQIRTREMSDLLRYGCTDAHCRMIRRPVGMHTNGGCRCVGRLADLALDVAACAEDNKHNVSLSTVMP